MITKFFEEKPGVKSSTRLFSFILLWFLIVFDLAFLLTKGFVLDYNFTMFNFLMLIGVFAPKFLHKLAENKLNIKPTEKT
jgi:hypothetical protein